MRVLVTGAGGFLGRHLVARLLARGDRVTALDLAFPEHMPDEAERITGSVTDPEVVRRAVAGAEGVIHAAAVTGLWARDPRLFERVNTAGSKQVFAAAAEAGARRAVLVSSYTTLISGRRSSARRRLDETEELPPETLLGPYPRSKRRAELAALQGPLKPAIVLPAAPVGPGDATPTPPGAMLRDMAEGRLPAMIRCDWAMVDIRAVADATIAALERGVPGRRYLLAGETIDTDSLVATFERASGLRGPRLRVPYGIALLAARLEAGISRLTGTPPKAPLTGLRLAGPALSFDGARAREELGFDPGCLETAMRDALTWMRGQGLIARALPALPPEAGGQAG
ncbi:MAG: NAD-dependent epimerase/dehydratase family protein [Pikeienuella sp.]